MNTAPDAPLWVVLAGLRSRLRGLLVLPGDAGYGLVLPWNRAVTVAPVAIVMAEDVGDIVSAVRFAGEHHVGVAVQATGHGATPLAGDVVLVHTARLDRVDVDPVRRTARVGAGAVWQQVIDAAAPHGLTPVGCAATTVGVVGSLSGGGVGPLAATYGLSSDHVRSLDVITGDGVTRHVTPTEHPDLFWALRGGRSVLGIINAVEIDLLPRTEVYGGALYFDGRATAAVLRAWAAWSAYLPEHATTSLAVLRPAATPDVPEPIAGRRVVAVRYASVAEPAEAEALLAPIRAVATPVLDGVDVLPCTRIGDIHADPQAPAPVHADTTLLGALPAEAVDALLAAVGPAADLPLSMVELRRLGGQLRRPPLYPSAFCHRGAAYLLSAVGLLVPPDEAAVLTGAAQVLAAARPWSTGTTFANFAPGNDPARLAMAYDEPTRHHLAELARRYDPDGIFAVCRHPLATPEPRTTDEDSVVSTRFLTAQD